MFLSFEVIILIVALAANLLLAFIVYTNNPKSVTHIIFVILALITSIWLIINHIALDPLSLHTLLLSRLSIFLAVPQVTLFFLLATTLPYERLQIRKLELWILLLVAGLIMFITLSPFTFTNAIITNGKVEPVPGWGIIPFALYTVLCSIAVIYTLTKRIRLATGIEKEQLRLVMVGILLMLSLIIATILIPVAIFKNILFVPLAPLYTLTFLGVTTYAIVKHRLLDIRLVVARSVAYTLLIIILGLFYTADIFLISNYFFQSHVDITQAIIYALLAFFIAITFQPLKKLLEDVTDKIFFKGNYNSSNLSSVLTQIMASTFSLEDLTKKTLHELLTTIRVTRGAFIIFRDGDEYSITSEGYNERVIYNREKLNKLYELKRIIIFDEEENEQVKQLMREFKIAVSVPLFEDGHTEGLLVLGEKKSGEIFSKKDIDILEILGPGVSVAINNAKSYEEISKFNATLKGEVEKATKNLTSANERLKELDKLKNEFVSLASHELRTPMTAIKSYLWMALEGKGGPLNEKQKYYVDRAYISADKLIKMVNDMLNISRIESGRLSINVKSIALEELVQNVIEEITPRAKEIGVSVTLAQPGPLPPVIADSDKIKEVLFNLIGNSLKFTPKGGSITLSLEQKDTEIEIKVSDTGSGIDKDNLPKLFQKFGIIAESYASEEAKATSGTGLGLYISKSIIELHEGRIWATSEGKGKGTQFTFSLKVFNDDDYKKFTEKYSHNIKEGVDLVHTQV